MSNTTRRAAPFGNNVIQFEEAVARLCQKRIANPSAIEDENSSKLYRGGLPTENDPQCCEWLKERYRQRRLAFRLQMMREIFPGASHYNARLPEELLKWVILDGENIAKAKELFRMFPEHHSAISQVIVQEEKAEAE